MNDYSPPGDPYGISEYTERRMVLIAQTDKLNKEIEDLEEAIAALE